MRHYYDTGNCGYVHRGHHFDDTCPARVLDRQLVDEFRYYAEAVPDWTLKLPDFEFVDTFDWQCRGYHWWFEWACHAIVWGIAQYDQHQATAAAAASSERALSEAARKEPGR